MEDGFNIESCTNQQIYRALVVVPPLPSPPHTQTHTHTHTHSLSLPSNVDCTHKQEDAFLRDVEKVAAASGFCTMLSVYTFRLDVSDLADVGVHGQEQEKQTSRKTSRSRVVKPAMPKDVAPEDTALGE